MTDYEVFPDAEKLVGDALRAASLTVGSRVYSSIPKTPTFPLITIQRTGGTPVERHRLDQARIQVDVWGESKSQAHDIAQAARVAIHRMEGSTPTGAVIGGVDDILGLAWSPDPVTHRDRYIFGVSITLHAD